MQISRIAQAEGDIYEGNGTYCGIVSKRLEIMLAVPYRLQLSQETILLHKDLVDFQSSPLKSSRDLIPHCQYG